MNQYRTLSDLNPSELESFNDVMNRKKDIQVRLNNLRNSIGVSGSEMRMRDAELNVLESKLENMNMNPSCLYQ